MKLRSLKTLGACAVLGLAVSGLAAAQASAIEFIYKVNGAKLEAGTKHDKEFTFKAETNQVLKATVLGVANEITCTTVDTLGAKILGGVPGTSTETVHYSGCTVQKPAGCKVKEGKVTTNALTDEIVEGVGASAGLAEVLFAPASGSVFAEIKLEGFFCPSVSLEGSVLAEVIQQKEEVETVLLKFEPTESKKCKNSKGEEREVGLKAATITGTVQTTLATKEKFGIF